MALLFWKGLKNKEEEEEEAVTGDFAEEEAEGEFTAAAALARSDLLPGNTILSLPLFTTITEKK